MAYRQETKSIGISIMHWIEQWLSLATGDKEYRNQYNTLDRAMA